jgi:hypothetical protein
MLALYGLEIEDSDPDDLLVAPAPEFRDRARRWLTPGNHNYLRLTRILESLCILHQRSYAMALFSCLDRLYRTDYGAVIGDRTLAYWRRQVE